MLANKLHNKIPRRKLVSMEKAINETIGDIKKCFTVLKQLLMPEPV